MKGPRWAVYSSAVSQDNPEIRAAKERRIPLMKRAEMLAELMRSKKGVAVAGTHGKTTTTSILVTILRENHFHPTYVIGGVVHNLKGHAKAGAGDVLVAEADESDGSFLFLNPVYSIITNIDGDHLDHYQSEKRLLEAFEAFANRIPFDGLCALNAHDPHLMEMTKTIRRPFATFGLQEFQGEERPHLVAFDLVPSPQGMHFTMAQGRESVPVKFAMPGKHNVLNVPRGGCHCGENGPHS